MGSKPKTPKSTTTKTEANPWQPAQGQLKAILGQAQALYKQNGGLDAEAVQREIPGLTPDMAASLKALADSGQLDEVANNLTKYTSGAGAALDKANQLANEFTQKDFNITGGQINQLSSELYDSETVRSQKEQMAQDLNEQYNQSVQQLNQQAGAAGGMGNSRAGVAQGVMAGKAGEAQAKGEADIMNSARQQAQQAALATLQGNQQANMNQYTQGMQFFGNMGTTLAGQYQSGQIAKGQLVQQGLQNQFQAANVSQQMKNAQQETRYQNQVAAKNAGQENLNNYLNTVGRVGGLGGTNTGTSSGGGATGPSSIQAGIGGAMSGAASGAMIGSVVPGIGTAVGAVAGGVLGGASGLFSDATLKKDIKLKGKTKSGDEVYDWEWNEKGKKKGMKGKGTGVLAQRTDASAVVPKQGALAVQYDKTSVKPKVSKK